MQSIQADIFEVKGFLKCVTTNGVVGTNGKAVMGAGVAKAVRDRIPGIDEVLAAHIRKADNHVHLLGFYENSFWVSFPTKHSYRDGAADLALIERSCRELKNLLRLSFRDYLRADKRVILPRPGCGQGTGNLDWEKQVKPVIEGVFPEAWMLVVSKD